MDFIKEEYDRCDAWAKDLFISYLEFRGHVIIKTHEDYKHDLISVFKGNTYHFELEVKTNYSWTNSYDFKFSTVSFLARKKKLHEINEFYYVIICKETLDAIACLSSLIFNEKYLLEITLDKVRKGNDKFYRVPKDQCRFFTLVIK